MIIINQEKLEQARQKLKEQKLQLANKIATIMTKIQDEDDETRNSISGFLGDKYSNLLKENEKEIEIVDYIKNHTNIIEDYFVAIDEKPINDVIDKVIDEYSEDLSYNRG